ncbi:hypothetical protein CCR94_16805 [Rhodoblastus sphagnicola]|uniref:Acyltransferase 3 domain-containing protein n=2 Tax=Rhodoblastus sphagnicola TaxID=333368 RepID=A0A2S6N2K9_9HYPH|nr:acyltransferase family protein [Rhodoblastus sphagnicola]PPQ28836.1 hypothetical protein CCR94_16805 [Rhodoblastus sphagnicola]
MLGAWTLGPAAYYNIYHTMLGRLDQFLIGMAAAAVFAHYRGRISKGLGFALAALALALLTAWLAIFGPLNYPLNMLSFTVEALLFSIVIIGFHAAGGVRGRVGRALAVLGSASYSLYLLHLFVGAVVLKLVNQWAPDLHMAGFLRTLLFVFLPSIALSLLTYFSIEKPFIELGKKLGPNAPTEVPAP